MRATRRPDDRRTIAVAWAVAVAALLLAPVPSALGDLVDSAAAGLPFDKLVHVALFALLGRSWLAAAGTAGRARTLVVALAAVAYGGALELAQELVPSRGAEWLDLVADAAGVALAGGLQRRKSGGVGSGSRFSDDGGGSPEEGFPAVENRDPLTAPPPQRWPRAFDSKHPLRYRPPE